jgi:hypothetical protein
VVAETDPQGSIALDAYRRRQKLKSYEYLNGEVGAADRKRMVAVMNTHHGIPRGSKVTVKRVLVPSGYDYDCTRYEECYRFSTHCPVAEQMLASLGDDIDMLRGESAIRLMEVYGVLVDREYPA